MGDLLAEKSAEGAQKKKTFTISDSLMFRVGDDLSKCVSVESFESLCKKKEKKEGNTNKFTVLSSEKRTSEEKDVATKPSGAESGS